MNDTSCAASFTCVSETILTDPNKTGILVELQARLTDVHTIRRLGTLDDVAALVRFDMSDEADWITSIAIDVDGGASRVPS